METTATTPTLTLQARLAGSFFMAEEMIDEARFLAFFGRRVLTGRPVTAAMLERADGLIRIAEAVFTNDEAASAAA